MKINKSWSKYLNDLSESYLAIKEEKLIEAVLNIRRIAGTNNSIWIIGNGGSAATSSHFSVDLSKGTSLRLGKTLKAIPLMDLVPIQSAWSNDFSYAQALEKTLRNFAQAGDLLFVISGSGNSENLVNAIKAAKEIDMKCLGLTGFSGGKISALLDLEINVPSNDMQIIEDAHHTVCHFISREI
jgi:D-sedoheptulose 7-phosphate isomerase